MQLARASDSVSGRGWGVLSAPLKIALFATGAGLLAALGLLSLVLSDVSSITTQFFHSDRIWLAWAATALIALPLVPATAFFARLVDAAVRRPRLAALVIAVAPAVVALAGTYLVFGDYALSRDEHMAKFDAAIFVEGNMIARPPPEWRPFLKALEPEFRLPIPDDVAWVSSYLPGNAALRALFSFLGAAALANPVLVALAVLALMGVARRLFPDRPDAVVLAGVLLATSLQVLVMAMTSYAMTAHLALNLLWLWLFLRDDRLGHLAAVTLGFAATGLHQMIFHPLFVAPFILQLWLQRRLGLAAWYSVAYAMIGLFWVLYWQLLLSGAGIAASAAADVGAGFLVRRVAELIASFSWNGLDVLAKNLVRFIAWQNAVVAPLALLSVGVVWRSRGPMRPIAGGIGLTIVVMFMLLPDQIHGWGYRYLHGVIGNLALLAVAGFVAATMPAAPSERIGAWSAVGWASAFTILVLLPGRALEAWRFVVPYATASAAIRNSRADVVVVNSTGLSYGIDLVRNDPFLRNTPKVLAVEELDAAQLRGLCERYRVALFTKEDGVSFGIPPYWSDWDPIDRPGVREVLRELQCGRNFRD